MTRLETNGVYVGFKPCGCFVAFSADVVGMEKETAEDVADFIRSGYRVQHMTDDEYDANVRTWPCWMRCPHGANPKARQPRLTEQPA